MWFDRKYLNTAIILVLPAIAATVCAGNIFVANHSFEYPVINTEDHPLYAIPYVAGWTEDDVDTEYSSNTGTFLNLPQGAPGHIVNAVGNQLALIGSEYGNGLWQFLPANYKVGKSYRLTVALCPSSQFPPPPGSSLAMTFFYLGELITDAKTVYVQPDELTPMLLKDFSVTLPPVQPTDPWAGKPVGIAFRAIGSPGGYWDLDNVRVTEFPRAPDLTGDGRVNLRDFAVMAAAWQSCDQPDADVTGDGCVLLEDFLILAEYWLETL